MNINKCLPNCSPKWVDHGNSALDDQFSKGMLHLVGLSWGVPRRFGLGCFGLGCFGLGCSGLGCFGQYFFQGRMFRPNQFFNGLYINILEV